MPRDATEEETEAALVLREGIDPNARNRHDEAIGEGHKDQVCGKCGDVFLAHIHFITCRKSGCEMRCKEDPRSLLEKVFEPMPDSEIKFPMIAGSESREAVSPLVDGVVIAMENKEMGRMHPSTPWDRETIIGILGDIAGRAFEAGVQVGKGKSDE